MYAERGLFLYNMEIVDAQCDYMQTVQKASVQLMLIIINFVPGTKDTLKLDQVNSANLLSMFWTWELFGEVIFWRRWKTDKLQGSTGW